MMLLVLASVLSVGLCMPGGWTVHDPKDPICQHEFQLLTTTGRVNLQMTDVTLVSCSTQVVSGLNYDFKFTVGSVDNAKACELKYYSQSWTKSFQVNQDTCSVASTNKRQLAGGFSPVHDHADPMYAAMLKTLMDSNQLTLRNCYHIVKIEQQVVAGMNYKFTINHCGAVCHFVVYQGFDQHVELSQIYQNTCTSRRMRQIGGGWSPVTNMADPGFQSCVAATLDKVNGMSNDMLRLIETKFVSAEQQVVAGMKYRFTMQVGESSCMNSGDTMGFTASKCPLNANSMMQQTTWDSICVYVAWQQKTDVLSVTQHHM